MKNDPVSLPRYAKLAEQEAQFWGSVQPSKDNPQLWDDPLLFGIFFKPQWDALIGTVSQLGRDVLEVGCGEGNLTIELAERGLSVDAMDISEDRIHRARDKSRSLIGKEGANMPHFEVADLNMKDLPPARYDVVVAHDALHHILRLDRLLDEIAEALRPGGSLVVYDYVGMRTIRKFLAAALYALLPTYQPYGRKFGLAKRLGGFLRSEAGKREHLQAKPPAAGNESPFEEISQGSIVKLIEEKFDVIEKREFHPFFFYLAPKIRLPKSLRGKIMRWFAFWDERIVRWRIAGGAYVYIIARKRS